MGKKNLVEKRTQNKEKRILVLDTRQEGINAIWREWEGAALDVLMLSDERRSREVYDDVQARGIRISRSSVIQFLERLTGAGFTSFRVEPCKGGTRRIYKLKLRTWPELNDMVIDRLLFKLWEIFPDNERINLVVT